ncbi:MAG: hypothetical protein WCI77_01120 [Candidatus Omnitrophota bacterium]
MFAAKSVKEVIALLHVDVIAEQIESVHKIIRESYKVKKYVVEDYEEFKNEISRYYQYHFSMWIDADSIMPPDLAHTRARNILKNQPNTNLPEIRDVLGSSGENGYTISYKNAKTGRYGGLIGVIDALAEGIKNDAISKYVSAVFLDCVNPMDFDKKIYFIQEYLKTYGQILLPGEEFLSIYELANDLEAIIQNHVKIINEFRKKLQ